MTANKAASIVEVPPTTLKEQLSGRVNQRTNPGPKQYVMYMYLTRGGGEVAAV